MSQMIEYRATRVDLKEMDGGGMLLARTDKGQVVIHMTTSVLLPLVRQTKLLQLDAIELPARPSDKDLDYFPPGTAMSDKRVLKCHQCGGNLVLLAEGDTGRLVACLICRASNDAKEVLENSAGLIGGTITPEEALNLVKQ